MAYAIMRWVKVTSQKQADDASGHNARTSKVANADKEALYPNIEFVITDGRGYWELATERIAEVVTRKVRDDQVRCMEVILTASPEFFERDANGRAVDMKDSQWAKDQLTFLEKTFGKENVLSCTLHQDEKSPHVHAVIAPITEDGHLSAKRLFNPITMTGYQTAYAEAMKPHGLARGIEHSQAEHQPMKKMYGQQGQTAAELGAQLGPVSSYQNEQVKRPGAKDYLNLSEWEAKTSAQVNEKARAQVDAANKRVDIAQNLALENASAKEQVRVLQKQLSTSEKLKEGHYGKLVDAAKRAAGGEPASPELIKQGNHLLDQISKEVKIGREQVANQIAPLNKEADQAERKGDYARVAEIRYGLVQRIEKPQKELETNFRGYKGGAERLDKLDEEQVKAAANKVEQAKKDEVEQARKALYKEIIAQGDREKKQQAEALRVQKHELSLMDRAFTIYRWNIRPDELTACLLVPKEKAEQVEKALRIEGSSYAASLGVQGEPMREDGLKAVYVKYQASFAHRIGSHMDRIREIGGQVYEHAGSQTKREQLEAKPQQKAQEREQEIGKSKDQGQSM